MNTSTWTSDLSPGARLGGRFRVIRPIAHGGCARVYLARDEAAAELCVLKVATGAQRRLLRRESHSLSRLDHPRVVRPRGSGSEGPLEFLALEFIEGPTLEELRQQRGGKLPPEEAMRLLGEIADGLAAMHAEGLVHADVKGENVLVHAARGAVLIDAGLGSVVHPGSPTAISGTPSYLPPERATGAFVPAHELPRLDVYSLAVLAYELLFGVLPLSGGTVQELVEAHANGTPSAPPEAPWATGALADVFERALVKDPSARTATPHALVSELRRALTSTPAAGLRFIVADDDESWLSILALGLERSFPGADVVCSANGVQAVETALIERPTAAIVDAEMPRLDGGGLVRALRARWGPELPIVVITGAPMSACGIEARAGSQAMLVKPVTPQAVALTLAAMLDLPERPPP